MDRKAALLAALRFRRRITAISKLLLNIFRRAKALMDWPVTSVPFFFSFLPAFRSFKTFCLSSILPANFGGK